MSLRQRLDAATTSLPALPSLDACLLLGTGLGSTFDALLGHGMEISQRIPYSEIEQFPHSSVVSHKGELAIGRLGELSLGIFQGRFHLYEGWSALDTAFPSYLARELGAKRLIISNAAGALNPSLRVGGLMLIEDHINMTAHNPLLGWEDESIGSRFPDMSRCYSEALIGMAHGAAEHAGLTLQQGIYTGVLGPSLETSAERRWLSSIGGDAVGMSTVMEVIAARQCGLEVVGFSAITNIATGLENQTADSIESVLANAALGAEELAALLPELLKMLAVTTDTSG